MKVEDVPETRVEELMTHYVVMVEPELSVMDTIERMVEHNFRCVIVARTSPYKELGLVTRFDIMEKVIARGLDPRKVKITEIMEKPVYFIDHDAPVKKAAELMGRHQVCNLPVKKGRDVVGVISSTDIFNAYLHAIKP